jgi:hypothetical protein
MYIYISLYHLYTISLYHLYTIIGFTIMASLSAAWLHWTDVQGQGLQLPTCLQEFSRCIRCFFLLNLLNLLPSSHTSNVFQLVPPRTLRWLGHVSHGHGRDVRILQGNSLRTKWISEQIETNRTIDYLESMITNDRNNRTKWINGTK